MSSVELTYLIAFHGVEGFACERHDYVLAEIAASITRQNARSPSSIKAERYLFHERAWKDAEATADPVKAEIEHYTSVFGDRLIVVEGYRKRAE